MQGVTNEKKQNMDDRIARHHDGTVERMRG